MKTSSTPLHWIRARSLIVALSMTTAGCVDRTIVDASGSKGGGDSEGDLLDTISDSGADFPDAPVDTEGPECFTHEDCRSDQDCYEGTCVGKGEFRVSLSWTVVSDFDLHVLTPTGQEIWFAEPAVASGYLDVDDCVGGGCRDIQGVHVENVFFNGNATRGEYTVWVVNFDGSRAGDFDIEVAGAAEARFGGTLPAFADSTSPVYGFEF